jgi:hypothetical protein
MKEAFVAWMVRSGRYMTIWNERSPCARFPAGAWGRNELIFAWLRLVPARRPVKRKLLARALPARRS